MTTTVCVYCHTPIQGACRGAGDGNGDRFAHNECWWRVNVNQLREENTMTTEDEEIAALKAEKEQARLRYVEIAAKLDKYKVKCPTCRCKILPGEECFCCGDDC